MDRIGRLPMLLNTIPTGIGQVARNAAAMLRQPPCHCIHQPWRCRSPMTIADDDVGGLRGGKRRHRVHVAKQRQRSEEHTSELQSLMRKSYADYCMTKNKHN